MRLAHCGEDRGGRRSGTEGEGGVSLFPRAKHKLMGWCEEQWRVIVATVIAEEIELSVAGPGECCDDPYCPDAIRFRQSMACADIARRVGDGK
jgi:hypothetical protein